MRALNLKESLELLKKYSIPVAETHFVRTESDLEEIAEKIEYPVVVKPNVSEHKTEIGIFKGLKTPEEIKSAFRSLNSEVAVQEMISGFEILLGGKRDENFGHVIALGIGGIFAELFEDVSFRIVPVSRADFDEMLSDTKLAQVANGFRGFEFDVERLFRLLKNFERLLIHEDVIEADINPLMAGKNEIAAVDARIILS